MLFTICSKKVILISFISDLNEDFWIGLKRYSLDGKFEQTMNGESLENKSGSSSLWTDHEPNGYNDHQACVRAKSSKNFLLADYSCSHKFIRYVCQIQANFTKV